WLDLDTQGRLLLRVSMEGESDDIQFYFGKAFRTLKRCERDMTRKITDKVCSSQRVSMWVLTFVVALCVHSPQSLSSTSKGPTLERYHDANRNQLLSTQPASNFVASRANAIRDYKRLDTAFQLFQ